MCVCVCVCVWCLVTFDVTVNNPLPVVQELQGIEELEGEVVYIAHTQRADGVDVVLHASCTYRQTNDSSSGVYIIWSLLYCHCLTLVHKRT